MRIKRLRSSRYQVRWRDKARIQRSRNFRTLELARDFVRDLELGEGSDGMGITFDAYAKRWLTDYAAIEKAETSKAEDERLIRLYLAPAFGPLQLGALRKTHLLELRAKLKRTESRYGRPLAPKTVNNVLTLAKTMLKTAVAWEILRRDITEGVDMLPKDEQAFAFWTAEERDLFIERCRALPDRPFAELVLVAAHTGLRAGELRALKRHQLDFQTRQIRVDASYSAKLKCRFDRTKNRRVAFVPMNDTVYESLVVRSVHNWEGDRPVFDEVLFRDLGNKFRRRCRQTGSREIRFHDLRHTCASTLVMAGVPLYTVQRLMRHKSIAMTERYAHLAPDYLAEAANAISARKVHRLRIAAEN